MAKNNKNKEENIVDLGSTYERLLKIYEENKKIINGVATAIVAIPVLIIFYINFIKNPKEQKASEELFVAEYYFGLDSFRLSLNGGSDFLGFEDIAADFGGTKAGNLARYYAGICHLRLGNYEDAIFYLSKFRSKDVMVGAIALGATGDAYRELGDSENAVKFYMKAVRHSNNNFTSPIYLKKAGLTYEEDLNNLDKALEAYKRIEKEYYNTREGQEISKYIARVEAKINNK